MTAPRLLPYHLAGADSLREIVNGLGCCNGKLVHLGIKEPPRRSTLSYAISRRPTRCFSSRVGRLVCSSTTIAKRNFSRSCSGGCRIISALRVLWDAGRKSSGSRTSCCPSIPLPSASACLFFRGRNSGGPREV